MKNALILHGTDGHSQENWFPWLQQQLENIDYKVWTPDLPNANKPNFANYNKYILNNIDFEINKETIIIGHSSGAVAILGLLQELPPTTIIQAAYLVGSFKNDLGWEALSSLSFKSLDYDKIKKQSRFWYFIHSDNDPYYPLEHAQYLHQQIGGDLIVLPGQKHFSVGSYGEEYKQFPYLFHLIAKDVMKASDVLKLYQDLEEQGIKIWIDGGFGVDALLGEQTRSHGDVDIVIEKKNVSALNSYLMAKNYREIVRGDTSPHNYMFGNDQAQLIDIHVVEIDGKGNGIYGPVQNNTMYEATALSGIGMINKYEVRCISPEWVVKFHSGYPLRESDYHDVLAICQKYNIRVPTEYSK